MKYQQVTLSVQNQGETLSKAIDLDDKYKKVTSIEVISKFLHPPAVAEQISFNGDSSIFDSGIEVGFFQNLEKKPRQVDIAIEGTRKFAVKITDESEPTAFIPYKVQFVLGLE